MPFVSRVKTLTAVGGDAQGIVSFLKVSQGELCDGGHRFGSLAGVDCMPLFLQGACIPGETLDLGLLDRMMTDTMVPFPFPGRCFGVEVHLSGQ